MKRRFTRHQSNTSRTRSKQENQTRLLVAALQGIKFCQLAPAGHNDDKYFKTVTTDEQKPQ